MKVAEVKELSKTRGLVTLEDGYNFPLYKRELYRFDIKEGEEVSEEVLEEIRNQILPKRCRSRAMNLLVKKTFTRKELEKKLLSDGYSAEEVGFALDYVESFHYVDDYRYAYGYIAARAQQTSRKKLEMDLRHKGIDENTFQKAFDEYSDSEGACDDTEIIKYYLNKKHYSPSEASVGDKQKMYAFLMRKGFESSKIMHCLNIFDF